MPAYLKLPLEFHNLHIFPLMVSLLGPRLAFEFPLLQSRYDVLLEEGWIKTYRKLFIEFSGLPLIPFLLTFKFTSPRFLL